MLAVFVNCFTVIVGGLIGVLFSSRIKESLSVTVQNAAGVITLVLGFEMAFQYESIICLALSLILGGLIGTALDIDGAIYKLGQFFEKLVEKKSKKAKNPQATSTASVDGEVTSEVADVKNQLAQKKRFCLWIFKCFCAFLCWSNVNYWFFQSWNRKRLHNYLYKIHFRRIYGNRFCFFYGCWSNIFIYYSFCVPRSFNFTFNFYCSIRKRLVIK